MAKKKSTRWVKKGFGKTKGWKKTGRTRKKSKSIVTANKNKTETFIKRSRWFSDVFPDRYQVVLPLVAEFNIPAGRIDNTFRWGSIAANHIYEPLSQSGQLALRSLTSTATGMLGLVYNSGFAGTDNPQFYIPLIGGGAAIYNYCFVYGSEIKAELLTFGNDTISLTLCPFTEAAPVSSMYGMETSQYSKTVVVGPNTPHRSRSVRNYMTMMKAYATQNKKEYLIENLAYSHLVANEPQIPLIWGIGMQSLTGGGTGNGASLRLTVRYYCIFHELNDGLVTD